MIQKALIIFFYETIFFYFGFFCYAHAAEAENIKEIICQMTVNCETCDLAPFAAPMFLSYVDLYKIYLKMLKDKNEIVSDKDLLKLSDNAVKLRIKKPIKAEISPIAPSMMADIIKDFFWHQFPHGKPSFTELEILSTIAVELIHSAGLDCSILSMANPTYEQYLKEGTFIRNKKIDKDWLKWKPRHIAYAITMRDVSLLRLTDYNEMDKYVKNQYGTSCVTDIFATTDRTTMWLIRELLRVKEKERRKVLRHILQITKELHALNNIHGVMTFVLALQTPELIPLINGLLSEEKSQGLKNVSEAIAFSEFFDCLNAEDTRLPPLNKIFQKLIITELPKTDFKESDIARMANAFKQVSICKRQSHYKLKVNKQIFEFFKNLPLVSQQTLDNLYYVRTFLLAPPEITELLDRANYFINSVDFAAYVTTHVGEHVMQALFEADIFTFRDLQFLLREAESREEKKSILCGKGISAKDAGKLSHLLYLHRN